MKSLLIACNNFCGWKGELRSLDKHIEEECENAFVQCPNMCCSGNTSVLRQNLKHHLNFKCPRRKQVCEQCGQTSEHLNHQWFTCPKRQYSCPHCNEAGCHDERTTTHLSVCRKVKIRCHKCSIEIFRMDEAKHYLTCTHEPVNCKYYNIGCKETPLRKDAETHEKDTQLHLAIATDKVLELTNALFLKNMMTFKVTNFNTKKITKQGFFSPPFFTSRSGYKVCVRVDANGSGSGEGTHVSVYAYLMKGDNDASLTWPFTGTVTIELLNQLEDDNHDEVSFTFPAEEKAGRRVFIDGRAIDGYGIPRFISYDNLGYQPDNNSQYLKDDTLVFRVSAEAPNYKPWLECTS